MNLSQMDFNFLKEISTDSFRFNVYHPEGKDWEDFNIKWNEIAGFLTTSTLEVENDEKYLEDSIDLEKATEVVELTEEVPVEPTDHQSREGN
ncbi:hypothetical protein J1N35_011368 [Gossypium stocksii]|uniref:Uncharacterized protein n=1 Tax=Gossypium stocksii TaxID=47602 RepID=A0A9D3W3W5_9ROSI|nr:hypothetical protein J1N35_011368 [Gossypium stocksii]